MRASTSQGSGLALAVRRAGVVLAVAGVLAGCGGTSKSPPAVAPPTAFPAAPSGRPYWIVQDFDVQPLLAAGLPQSLLEDLFDNPQTLLIVKPGFSSADQLLPHASRVADYASLTKLTAALQQGGIPQGTSDILFDDEHWAATPADEQANPFGSASKAEELAHAHGYHFIFTPAANISQVLSSTFDNATKYQGYLSLGLAGQGAKVSDVFEVQAQQDEGSDFTTFVRSASAQALAANPHVLLLVGLTSRAPNVDVTSRLLLSDYEATRSLVSGYWLNLPGGHGSGPSGTAAMVGFLQQLGPRLGSGG